MVFLIARAGAISSTVTRRRAGDDRMEVILRPLRRSA